MPAVQSSGCGIDGTLGWPDGSITDERTALDFKGTSAKYGRGAGAGVGQKAEGGGRIKGGSKHLLARVWCSSV